MFQAGGVWCASRGDGAPLRCAFVAAAAVVLLPSGRPFVVQPLLVAPKCCAASYLKVCKARVQPAVTRQAEVETASDVGEWGGMRE